MMRISDVLRTIEDRGAATNPVEAALVWIDRPEAGLYVRARDVRRIETYFRGRDSVWSKVVVALPDGGLETILDQRRPRTVRDAVERAEVAAFQTFITDVANRLGLAPRRSEASSE